MAGPPEPPDIPNFQTFLYNVAGIPQTYLPSSSPIIGYAFNSAVNVVNQDLGSAPAQLGAWSILELATYNLGTHFIIEYASDVFFIITAASWVGGLVTAATQVVNTLLVGDTVAISGISPNQYNGVFAVNSIIDNQHFTYPLQPNPGVATVSAPARVQEQFFVRLRQQFKINAFTPGVPSSASDQGTSVGLVVPEFFQNLSLYDLQLLKTPQGRAYSALAQQYGPTIWGLT